MEEKSRVVSWSAGIVAFLASIAFCYFAAVVLLPIIFSVFSFVLFDPLVRFAERWRVPRPVAAPVLLLLSILLLYGLGNGIYGSFSGMVGEAPRYSEKIRGLLRKLEAKETVFEKGKQALLPQPATPGDTQKVEVMSNPNEGWASAILYGAHSVLSLLADLLLIPILSVFFLLEKDYLKTHFHHAVGRRFPLDRVCTEIAQMVKSYFFGNILVGLASSVGFFAFFSLLGLRHRLVLALFAGFLNLVPVFGPLLGAVLPASQALLQLDGAWGAICILAVSLGFHLVVYDVVFPKLVGARINVNATAATIGFVFWGWLWGGVGLLLAIPLMAVLKILLSVHPQTASWANLIAENPNFPKWKVRKTS